ncbi:restriction endonuclease subunit S [Leeuwenhoekiella sp. NPDC079379]|uniref:restriction endonuclease subunit S n=1 Tax=Leeuwenhoekiella sp. NPDC079379 TaxID=3364122 RepID=UPI0037C94123
MMDGWKTIRIDDLGKVITGNTPPKKDPSNYGSAYPFIKPTDMDVGRRYVTSWEENYSDKAFKRYKNSYIPPGATGVVTIGTVGEKMFQADQYCFTNQSVNVVIPNESYDPNFVYYLLKINLPKVENANPGTASGRHHVSKSNFCAIKVKVPKSKAVQRKIASILSAYDDLIENNLKRIKLLEEQAQQTYEEWFVRFKFPGHEDAVFDEVSGLPEGWEKSNLEDLMILNYGKALKAENRIPGNYNVYGSSGIVGKHNTYLVSGPGIILGRKGNVGSVFWSENNFFVIDTAYYITTNSSPYYIYYLLKNENFVNNDAAIPGLSRKAAYLKEILNPNHEILFFFEKKIQSLFKIKINLQNQNQLLKEARDILLPRLMMGIVDVDDLLVDNGVYEISQENLGIAAEVVNGYKK